MSKSYKYDAKIKNVFVLCNGKNECIIHSSANRVQMFLI